MSEKDKLWRPPVDDGRRDLVRQITAELNKDSLYVLSDHDILNMCIDRAYAKMFPGKRLPKRKRKYIKIDF